MRSSKISAPNYEACIASAIEFVARHAETSEVLLVAPTTEAANEVVRRAFDGALIGVHTITLRNLARVLAESRLCAGGRAEISAVARQAVIARVATAARLDYFAPVASAPGFPKALSRTIRELRLHDVSPEGDLKALLQCYEEELEQHQLADVATIFRTAIRVVEESSHPFCGLPVVFLDAPVRHKLDNVARLVDKRNVHLAVFSNAEHGCRNEEERPFPSCRQPASRRYGCGLASRSGRSALDPHSLPEVALPHLPNEAIEVEVKKGGDEKQAVPEAH